MHAPCRDDGVTGEAGEQRVRGDRAIRPRDRRRAGRQRAVAHGVERVLAQDRAPDDAVTARAAARREAEHHALAGCEAGDSGPRASTMPGALVTEHSREREAPLAVGLPDVGVADPRRDDADEDLAGARLAQVDLLDPVRLAERVQNGGGRLH